MWLSRIKLITFTFYLYKINNFKLYICEGNLAILDYYKVCHSIIQVRGAHVFWEEFLSRLSQGAAVAEGGAVSHTYNQLETTVRAKRSDEAIELIPEVSNGFT